VPVWVFFGVLLLYALWARRYRKGERDRGPTWFFVLGCALMLIWAWLLIVAGIDGSGWSVLLAFVFAGFLLLATCFSIYVRARTRQAS
jgi:drug/metabolite transporter (DMT)-like permease